MTDHDLALMESSCRCYEAPFDSTCGSWVNNEFVCVCANAAVEAEGAQLPP
jgi:hypothetical protein